ncbi:CidA/LrgA family protein [Acinetobacter sp. SAAs470]|uniref:CidA/LrgA family protein n=1 Tax=unclassified Acinetobacter TaxID=196816 RepID=UPI00397752CA
MMLIMMIWGFAYLLQMFLHLPIAPGVLGFFILLLLLWTNRLKLQQIEQGADVLLAELLLFFIPPVVGVIQYQQLLLLSGWKIIVVILFSTVMVMITSVWMVRYFLAEDANT